MRNLLIVCLLLLALVSCQEEDPMPAGVNYVVFGHFYGFCQGERCVELYKIENDKLYEDTKDQYPNDLQPYEGNFVARPDADYQLVKEIPANFPQRLLQETRTVIGSPDAADGGGIYLEIAIDGERRHFLIDKMRHNVPEYLLPYLDYLEANIDLLK